MTFIRNRWYVAAWDGEVGTQPLGRKICGENIVMYRKLDGSVVAMRDACPHRLLPLSMGIREGDNLRCKYHGMVVGPDGSPCEMPLRNDPVNKKLCTPTYEVLEKHRFVWVWIGDQEKADPSTVPDFWPCSAEGWVFDGGYTSVGCDYRLFVDNLMDLTHETYVHMGTIGQIELMEAPLETTVDGDKVTLSRWMPGVDAPPFWRHFLGKEGPVNRWQICEFLEPCSVIIDVGVSPVEAGDTLESHDSGVRGFVIDSMTPETETSCHYFWGMARNFAIDDAGVTQRMKDQQDIVFNEDVEVLEAQQRSIAENPDMRLRILNIDSGGAHSRKVIERLMSDA
ncbi:aromatic ring-hydroxylating dioxygenase subunit alpha [Ponticaulis sp.]|uniref:aromatic ring-hydroxylating dioxygenase subunit alpha n=1 Tax=Ponticaulis sp. TaxID=2020902 RepID=UPI000B741F49|nr:aromatic ring-hydroxylating dioxygenase subunit alpha [Ponticaulis sp.]MAJ09765.1 Rieske (2Fe-2S) protein [Ponticaulis sp.]RPG17102.1 MAG: aromatic ring-hydroxylating dioxygenase subunit alpha [Hyphomonadaceae bacterium TMED125]|tara:strand:- start:7419 stop:8435 length:1017 start_codon:yes stop_codon:yes gene_type:complete